MTLLSRTKDMAKLRGMSLETLALKAGLSNKSIYNWDRNSPKSENLEQVATVLNVSTDYLLGRTDEMNATSSDKKVADILDDETILAFDGMEISEDDKEKLRDYARFIIEQRQRGKK